MIYGNARLWLGGRAFTSGALVVDSGVIRAIEAPGVRSEVDLGGAWVLPGLIDAHFHLQQTGAALRTVQLADARSEEEAADRISMAAKALPGDTWVIGGAWDDNRWPSRRLPTLASVAAVAQPMVMTRVDFHAVWVNAEALRRAGISRETPDPVGGRIVRDAAGEPTGVLVDAACDLVTQYVPLERTETLEQDVRRALARCARVGLTCVHDMMMSPEVLHILQRLDEAGELTLRVRAYMHGAQPEVDAVLRDPPASDRLRVMGRKLFADGALGSRGAALRAPYSDDPSTRGLLMMSGDELASVAARTHAAGRQVAIHAIGDHAAELAVAAIVFAQGEHPADRRHRVEHAQTITPELLPRFAKAGIVASMQPSHCTCDLGWALARLGPTRIAGAYAWRSFLDARVHLALGSDAPIASENPWDGIRSAVARTDDQGATITPEQRLTLEEALTGYTSGAAFAAHDATLGRLAPGNLADFVVIDRDPFGLPAHELAQVRTLRTVVGGATVFEQDA